VSDRFLVDAATLSAWLQDGDEIALLDVREHGQYGEGHPFFSVNTPYSELETAVPPKVPRRDTRVVLFDDGDDVAARAAAVLRQLGYTRVHELQGGVDAWQAHGRSLFQGVNVPSKTFGELVEIDRHTPHISAQELHRRQQAGERLVLIDGRTLAEHRKMTLPGAIPIPNGELALRIRSVLPDDETTVVVHCAGRTRSIIGAQTLRDLGLPNPVLALENGTQGWQLAGFAREHGSERKLPPPATDDVALDAAARHLAQRFGVRELDVAEAQQWLDDASRTCYAFDIRTAEEYRRGTLAGARYAEGGQLVQATDLYLAVRHSRILVLDDSGRRAAVVAGWLQQLGYEAATVAGGIHASLRVPLAGVTLAEPTAALSDSELKRRLENGQCVIDLRASWQHREAAPRGALWAIRPRLRQAIPAGTRSAILVVRDAVQAAGLRGDFNALGVDDLGWTIWDRWQSLGLPAQSTPDSPADAQAIDYLFFVHDRHDGNLEAARQYLAWETGLIAQSAEDELRGFPYLQR
jgi:rhodanese-related sulfurtransferase